MKRIFVANDEWTAHDHAIARWLSGLPVYGAITDSEFILVRLNYDRPSLSQIIREPIV